MTKDTVVANENLRELRSSGYEIVKGEPDIRGWTVEDSRGVVIGKVKELLFDIGSQKVRYLIVALDGKPLNLVSRDVLIPVGLAELDATENVVFFPDVTVGHLATLPEYKRGKISYKTEREIRDVFIPQGTTAADKLANYEANENPERAAFYNNEYYDEDKMYRRRTTDRKIANTTEDVKADLNSRKRYMPSTSDVAPAVKVTDDNVVYVPDPDDPSVLRKAKIVKE